MYKGNLNIEPREVEAHQNFQGKNFKTQSNEMNNLYELVTDMSTIKFKDSQHFNMLQLVI